MSYVHGNNYICVSDKYRKRYYIDSNDLFRINVGQLNVNIKQFMQNNASMHVHCAQFHCLYSVSYALGTRYNASDGHEWILIH